MRTRERVFLVLVASALALNAAAAADVPPGDLVLIDAAEVQRLEQSDLPVLWKGASFCLAVWNGRQEAAARRASIRFHSLAHDHDESRALWVFELRDDVAPPDAWRDRVLWRDGRKWVLEMDADEATGWAAAGHAAIRVPDKPRGWERRAPAVVYDCGYEPLIDDLLQATSQPRWLDWIEKLSGAEPVTVDGTDYTIETRYSSPMFSGAATAKAYDFALQQVQSWHYGPTRIEEHAYTGTGGQTWKNLILTLPGETAPGEIVLLTGHLDSINQSDVMHAPGANDNGTGNATLFEAARLLRRYRFERTIQIVWFTGEEDFLLGSGAFVDDHPVDGFLGVVNLDMFGWDGDGDRCFEIHAGTLSQSQDVADCFADSLTTYDLGLTRDYLTWGATDRSDHASFWQVNVGAIEIAENFFYDGLPDGCAGQDANPGYHTSNDTVASNLSPPFGFDIARAGLATIAAMAVPVGACFSDVPMLTALPGVGSVGLSWTPVAGAAGYRLYRSTRGCQGQWFEIAETTATFWMDDQANEAQTYSYRVEAFDADGFCVSAESNCAPATPTIYHASGIGVAPVDVCASGGPGSEDGILDPGESVLLPVTLENDGNTSLHEISGTLMTSTGGITVVDPTADWPDLDPGAAAQSLPDHFGLQVADGVSCGTSIETTVALDYAEGSNDTGLSVPVGNAYDLFLLDEDFSAGLPAGWTIVDGGTGGGAAATWTADNPGGRAIDPPFDPPFAIVDSDAAGSSATQDEQLISPSFDITGCGEVLLEFSSQLRWYSGSENEQADVDVSTDGGSVWTNKLRIEGGSDGYPTPVTKSVDITPTSGLDLDDVRIRFHFHQAQYEWWWAVDNVTVRCEMMACTPCESPGAPGEPGATVPLTMRRDSGDLVFEWGAPGPGCQTVDYAIYRGDLRTLGTGGYSHGAALSCATGATSFSIDESFPAIGEADYFLVVADNGVQEGSYGRDSAEDERPRSAAACHVAQDVSTCGR
jgi:leucyl aminopeptidase